MAILLGIYTGTYFCLKKHFSGQNGLTYTWIRNMHCWRNCRIWRQSSAYVNNQQSSMVTSCVTSLVSIVTTLAYGDTHPAKRIVTLEANFLIKRRILRKSMACIFIGLVAMIRSLVQRRKKNQIVPGSTAVDKAPGEYDGKDRGDARVGGHSRILWILFIALKHIF